LDDLNCILILFPFQTVYILIYIHNI
jgi:hypothetical protein